MIRIFYPSATYPLLRCDSCGAVYAADFQIAFCWVCRLIAIWPAVKNPREDWETNQTSEWQHLKPEAAQRVAYNRAQNAMRDREPERAPMSRAGQNRVDFVDEKTIARTMVDIELEWIENAVLDGFNHRKSSFDYVVVLKNITDAVKDAYLKRELAKREDKQPFRKCSVCGRLTNLACSDCRIDLQKTVHVCSADSCRDIHERDTHKVSAHRRADHMNQQLRQGQDVLYCNANGEIYPAKLIRQVSGSDAWNIVVFSDSGSQVEKNIQFTEQPTPRHFTLQQEQGRAVGGSASR